MQEMIHRALALAAVAALATACSRAPEGAAGADRSASAGGGTRFVAAAVTPEPTWTPPILVVIPPATATLPPTGTPPPTRTPPATRTPGAPTASSAENATSMWGRAAPTTVADSSAGTTAGGSQPNTGRGATATRPGPSATPRPKPPTPTKAPTEDRRLVTQLRRGGLVVYLRHGQTDWGQNDRELAWVPEMLADRSLLGDCDRQRLLHDTGRDQARRIGAAIAAHGIPVGTVLSSGWCRTRETAELALGRAEVAGDKLFDTGYLDAGSDERKAYTAALRELLSSPVDAGTNRFLVGHGPQIDDAARLVLQEGDAVVFRPKNGGFEQIGRLTPSGWENLGD